MRGRNEEKLEELEAALFRLRRLEAEGHNVAKAKEKIWGEIEEELERIGREEYDR